MPFKAILRVVVFAPVALLAALSSTAQAQHSVAFDTTSGEPGDTVTINFDFVNPGNDSALEARARISDVSVFDNIDTSNLCAAANADFVQCLLNDTNRIVLAIANFDPTAGIPDFSGTIQFDIDPAINTATLPRTIDLVWNAPEDAGLTFTPSSTTDGSIDITAPPPGQLALVPSPHDYGNVIVPGAASQTFTVANTSASGAQTLEIDSFSVSGDPEFSITGGTCTAGTLLTPGGAGCTIVVDFAPGTVGNFSGTLDVSSLDGQMQSSLLSGDGVSAPTPELSISPDPLNFGNVSPGDLPATDTFTISNTGDVGTSLTISTLNLTGDAQFSISADACTGATLNQGDTCLVDIEFDSSTNGMFAGNLQVDSDAGSVNADIQASTQIPSQLSFDVQPSDVPIGDAITPAVVVQVLDSNGDLVMLDDNTIVDLQFGNDPTGSALLGGTTSLQVSGGEAVFSDLSVDRVGSGFTLTATDAGAQLTPATSAAFDVLAGPAASLAFSVQPGDTTVGTAIAPAVEVQVLDAGGNLVSQDNATQVVLNLTGGDPAAVLSGGGPLTVSSGVAVFSTASIDTASTGYQLEAADQAASLTGATSDAFDIIESSSNTTIDSIVPAGSQVVGTPYTVDVSVTGVSPTGTVTIDDGEGNTCAVTLPVTSCDLTSTSTGTKTITASYPGDTNNSASSDALAYDITPAVTTVSIDDISPADSQSVNQPYTVTVSVTGFTPTGTVTVDDGNGENCQILLPDNSCSLTSSVVGSTTVTVSYPGDSNNQPDSDSSGYEILPGAPAQLAFSVQPADGTSQVALSPTVEVQVLDADGNLVTTDNSTLVSLNLTGGPGGAILSGGGPVQASSGVAAFPAASVDLAGTGYALIAAAAGLSSDSSDSFAIQPGPAAQLAFGQQPTNTLVASNMTPAVTVQSQDAAGNIVVSDNTTQVSLGLNGGTSGAVLSGGGAATVAAGLATFGSLSIDLVGSDYQLEASDSGALLTSAISNSFDIVSSSSSTVIDSIVPAGGQTVGQPYTVNFTVTGSAPTGVVTIDDGDGNACTATLPTTSCALTSSQAGSRTLTASYAGDVNNASSSDATTYTINQASSTTTLVSVTPAGSQTVGQSYSVEAQVAGFSPGGSVTVDDGQGESCTITLPDTVCSLTSTTAGPVTLSASYGGDANNQSSLDTDSYTIDPAVPAVAITQIDPSGSQQIGQPYTVSVTVDGFSATGLVTIDDGDGAGCQFDLSSASSCDLVSNSSGSKTITATYTGDANNEPGSDTAGYGITGSGPAQLAFSVSPNFGVLNGPLLPTVVVEVLDSEGVPIVSDDATVVELLLITNPTSATLNGTTTLTVSGGQASFEDLSIDQLGEGYQIEAIDDQGELIPAMSAPFDVVADRLFQDRFEQPVDRVFQDRFEQ